MKEVSSPAAATAPSGFGPDASSLDVDAPRFAAWRAARVKARRRRDAWGVVLQAAALELLALVLVLQFSFGLLSHLPFADALARVCLLVVVPGLALAMVVSPTVVVPAASRAVSWFFGGLIKVMVSVLLFVVFWVSWPYARVVGRGQFVRRHPGALAWVTGSADWRLASTWVPKVAHTHTRGGWSVGKVVGVFVRQRAWFVLAVVLLALVVTVLSIIAHSSSVVAPLIYTLI